MLDKEYREDMLNSSMCSTVMKRFHAKFHKYHPKHTSEQQQEEAMNREDVAADRVETNAQSPSQQRDREMAIGNSEVQEEGERVRDSEMEGGHDVETDELVDL